jgi:hypothetical protein
MQVNYRISGLILQPGYLNCKFEGALTLTENNSITGELNDKWGASKIEGQLTKIELTFKKRYNHRKDNIFTHSKKKAVYGSAYIPELL